MPSTIRKIPLRSLHHRPTLASVLGSCASWHCPCGQPVALQGRSGPPSGPTPETITTCPQCQRTYFVIPQDKEHGPPIEVVELFREPATPTETSTPATADAKIPAP